jgi:hypothetical protein
VIALLLCGISILNIVVIPQVAIGGVLGLAGIATALIGRRSGVAWPIPAVVLLVAAFFTGAYASKKAAKATEARAAIKRIDPHY